jgi:hypothetical protein
MATLSLNCFILGGDLSEVFMVETKNVGILKDLIKEKQSCHLNHVNALGLTIWKVSLPMDTITPELTVDGIETYQELHFVKKIFKNVSKALVDDDEHVHILV